LTSGTRPHFTGLSPRGRTILRWSLLIALPVTEFLLLSVRVDTASLVGKSGWWAAALGHAGALAASVFAAVAAGAMMVWARARRVGPAALGPEAAGSRAWPLLVAHVALFAGFAFLSVLAVEGEPGSSSRTAGLLAAWAASGCAAVACWCMAAVAPRRWLRLARENWGVALAAAGVGAAAWVGGQLLDGLWVPLHGPTFWLVQTLLRVCGQETVSQLDMFVLGTPTFCITIAPECSGYEGIGLVVVFMAAYLWLFRRGLRFPQALLLVPVGIVAIWLANGVRIAGLIILGTHVSSQIALGGFHSQAGWLGFIAVALGLVAVAHRAPFFAAARPAAAGPGRAADPTTAYLAPLMALIATVMVTAVVSTDFDWLYPVRVVVTGAVLLVFWRGAGRCAALAGCWSWGAVGIGTAAFALWMGIDWAMAGGPRRTALPPDLAAVPSLWVGAWIVFRVLGSVITVPMAEELAFRGYLLRRLISAEFDKVAPGTFTWLSFLVSSVLFGALHGRWLAGALAGMLYAWALYRRGRLSDAILAHATTNALLAAYVLGSGDWSPWE